jgi:hypothetical protein
MKIVSLVPVVVAVLSVSLAGANEHSEAGANPVATLVCGGVGIDDSKPMLGQQPAHSLTIVFAARDGSYLAGVDTRIAGSDSDVAIEQACGPIGLVDVPVAGTYRVSASFEGRTLENQVQLRPGGGDRLVLQW